jgi:hypothetical protein
MIGNDRLVERLLTAALMLTEPSETAEILDLRTHRHAALFSLGRLDEADEDYAVIDALTGTVLDRLEATPLQVRSLTNRGRTAEANDLGTSSLRECGIAAGRLHGGLPGGAAGPGTERGPRLRTRRVARPARAVDPAELVRASRKQRPDKLRGIRGTARRR